MRKMFSHRLISSSFRQNYTIPIRQFTFSSKSSLKEKPSNIISLFKRSLITSSETGGLVVPKTRRRITATHRLWAAGLLAGNLTVFGYGLAVYEDEVNNALGLSLNTTATAVLWQAITSTPLIYILCVATVPF